MARAGRDMDTADQLAHSLPTGPAEELFLRTAQDIWNVDAELSQRWKSRVQGL